MERPIYWGTGYDEIQKVFDASAITDSIVFYNKPDPNGLTPFEGPWVDLKGNTIKVKHKGKNKNESFTILGKDSYDNEITSISNDMPLIKGVSGGLMEPIDGKWGPQQDTVEEKREDIGIFHIGPGCFVKISGLHLVHEIPKYGPKEFGHSSATIANFLDNSQASSLNVNNCDIATNATTAISLRSDSVPEPNPVPVPNPYGHRIEICGCTVTGKPNTGILAGNYSSVNLGYWGKAPLDMRAGSFEVKACTLDSLYLGVAVWWVRADSASMFLVAGNNLAISQGPKGHKGMAIGVSFISWPETAAVGLAAGTIAILENTMRVGQYLGPGAAGILVRVEGDSKARTTTVISGNVIDMPLRKTGDVDSYRYRDGIVYESKGKSDVTHNVGAYIHNNSISVTDPPEKLPKHGIYLGDYACLACVKDNGLKWLKVDEALIQIGGGASRNTFVGNALGRLSDQGVAGILCDGSQNSFCDNNFSQSEIPGWAISEAGKVGKVCIKLGDESQDNVVILDKNVPAGTVPEKQYLPAPCTKGNMVVVIPEFRVASIAGQAPAGAFYAAQTFVAYWLGDYMGLRPVPSPLLVEQLTSQVKLEEVAELAKAVDGFAKAGD